MERLRLAGDKTKKASNENAAKDAAFTERYSRIRNNLKIIDSQELAVTRIWNEEYDDWYDDGGEEFYYEDNGGISDMLAEACDFVHTCIDTEHYKKGFEIGKQLVSMEILCDSEYGDDELSLEDIVYHELLHCDLKQVILDTAYCAYRAVSPAKRPEALYGVIANAKKEAITLEAVMQHGDEESPEFGNFLQSWMAYLGSKAGKTADRLIQEAAGLLDDVSLAVWYAKEYAAIHPGLYLNILENENYAAAGDMVSIGINALNTIPPKYIMRSRTALKTAEYVIETGREQSLLEKCYFVAYESDTSALNYLRVLLNGGESEKKREELQKVFLKLSVHKSGSYIDMYDRSDFHSEREENSLDDNMILLLRFLDGQFAEVLGKGLSKSEPLGWTGTFMKPGIALYLLYMYKGKWNGEGIAKMAELAKNAIRFFAEEYRKYICEPERGEENDLFCRLFLKWKSMTPMDSGVRDRAMRKITALLEKRTKGIMDANRRNYYGECAAYIAALGEVRESMGEIGAKQSLMTDYKDKYFRRRAFREAMRNYGWIDMRR